MIYLATDAAEQAVYFDLRKVEPRRAPGGTENRFYGLLGNGSAEVSVTIRSWRDCVDIAFGRGRLFDFIEERTARRMLGEMVRELVTTGECTENEYQNH